MATAIEMLRSVASQVQLSSPLGRWMQKVSILLDGSAAPQFSYAKRGNAAQSPVAANSNLSLNLEGASRGITYNGTSWTLTRGKTYKLRALGWFENFQADNNSLNIQWVDGNNAVLTTGAAACPGATFRPETSTDKASSAGGVEFVFTVPAGATDQERSVKLRCTSATGQADLPAGSWSALIEEIPG